VTPNELQAAYRRAISRQAAQYRTAAHAIQILVAYQFPPSRCAALLIGRYFSGQMPRRLRNLSMSDRRQCGRMDVAIACSR